MLYQSNRMLDAVVSKLIAASSGSPCDSMASCTAYAIKDENIIIIMRPVRVRFVGTWNLILPDYSQQTKTTCQRGIVCEHLLIK